MASQTISRKGWFYYAVVLGLIDCSMIDVALFEGHPSIDSAMLPLGWASFNALKGYKHFSYENKEKEG